MQEEKTHFLRNADSAALAEVFLVAAAVTIVGTRVFLYLSGYPQLGGGGLHIAHMLWGGLLITISLLLVLFLLNRRIKYLAAFIGGIGFGLFIDELGKFITADNDYFFRPTYAIIYIIFVILYFTIRRFFTTRHLTDTEHTANSLELLKEIVANDFSPQERERVIAYLEQAKKEGRDVTALAAYAQSAKITGKSERSYYASTKSYLLKHYSTLINQRWFRRSILYIFAAQLIFLVFDVLRFVFVPSGTTISGQNFTTFGFFDWGYVISACIAIGLILAGILHYTYSYIGGLRWFERATMVLLLLVGFFNFYHDQLRALLGILFHACVLYALNVIMTTQTNKTI